MGWISNKFQREGRAKWGKPISAEKRRAPLRKISYVMYHSDNLFSASVVVLECGHEVSAWGQQKARCTKCLKDSE